ncbi:MAG: PepSY-like domain-containing protein, partial [Candidatus Krumholzibacteriaceae bacterium]
TAGGAIDENVVYLTPNQGGTMRHVRCTAWALGVALIFCAPFFFGNANCQESKGHAKNKLPKVVMDAFQRAYPNATIRNWSRERENGKISYEIESVDGTIERSLVFAADGSVTEIEESVGAAALPEGVQKTVTGAFPGYTIVHPERSTKGTVVQYEIVLEKGKKHIEVTLDENGKIVHKK